MSAGHFLVDTHAYSHVYTHVYPPVYTHANLACEPGRTGLGHVDAAHGVHVSGAIELVPVYPEHRRRLRALLPVHHT